jgi:hypothetical protein
MIRHWPEREKPLPFVGLRRSEGDYEDFDLQQVCKHERRAELSSALPRDMLAVMISAGT